MIVFAVIWECYTDRSPIIPPRLFKACILILTSHTSIDCHADKDDFNRIDYGLSQVFLHGFVLFTGKPFLALVHFHADKYLLGAFYLPVYYQVQGASATKAGAQFVPSPLNRRELSNLLSL